MADDDRDRARAAPDAVPAFPVALRGYERGAVHSFAADTLKEVHALRRELASLLDRATTAEAQLAAVQRENQTLREGYTSLTRGSTVPTGTGARVERLLQAAEEEAAEVRAGAVREATRLLEQAREQADAHVRAAADEVAEQRAARDEEDRLREDRARADEERAAERLREAQEAAERLLADAEARAGQLAADAAADAAAVRAEAQSEAGRLVDRARAEADRLAAVERSVRDDLARLLTLITSGTGDDRAGTTAAGPPDGDSEGDDSDGDPATGPLSRSVAAR